MISPDGEGSMEHAKSIMQFPMLKYPSGIGIWINLVITNVNAVNIAVRHNWYVFEFIIFAPLLFVGTTIL